MTLNEALRERFDNVIYLFIAIIGNCARVANIRQNITMLRPEVLQKRGFKAPNIVNRQCIKEAADTSEIATTCSSTGIGLN